MHLPYESSKSRLHKFIRVGLLTAALVVLVTIQGLGVFAPSAHADSVPTGLPPSPTDVIKTTFAFFEDAPGSYLTSKTGLLTLNLTYDTTTMTLTKITGSVGTL